ncbi:MAG: hypothetical protein C5B50_00810 [Verrucomicrobia bacterium]|nr:MAG: hypothetical protein C5B50_00810 [Verrucomicrobiota bacterium]
MRANCHQWRWVWSTGEIPAGQAKPLRCRPDGSYQVEWCERCGAETDTTNVPAKQEGRISKRMVFWRLPGGERKPIGPAGKILLPKCQPAGKEVGTC